MGEIFHNKVSLFLIIKRNVSLNTSIFENPTKVSKLWVEKRSSSYVLAERKQFSELMNEASFMLLCNHLCT